MSGILLRPGHSQEPGPDNQNQPRAVTVSNISVSSPLLPRVLTGHSWAPHHTCVITHVWWHTEQCRQIQESVADMQIRLQMSRYPGICSLHNPGHHQSLSSIIKIVSHKQELCHWSEQEFHWRIWRRRVTTIISVPNNLNRHLVSRFISRIYIFLETVIFMSLMRY